jgi:hypothetical protein
MGLPGRAGASGQISITIGTSQIAEGHDYATEVLATPWDMNGAPYPDIQTTLKNIDRYSFKSRNGAWEMEGQNTDPKIWLTWTGINNTQEVLRMGDRFPIDTSAYRLLSFHLCSSQETFANVYWMYDRSPHNDPDNGVTQFVEIQPGCRLYVVDLKTFPRFSGTWSGSPIGLRLDPAVDPIDFDLAWVRLTPRDFTNTVPIDYSGTSSGTKLDFYLSLTSCGASDGIMVGFMTTTGSSGTFNWGASLQSVNISYFDYDLPLPESFESGSYYAYAKTPTGSTYCAPGTLDIQKAPLLSFTSPSYVSGPDYASQQISDPWGMANNDDIENTKNVNNVAFEDGILTAVSTTGDPQLHMNVAGSINSNKYRYATFRMFLPGEQTVANGWIQRFHWWWQGPSFDAVSTQDMVIYEGWHTYTIDLENALMETGGGWSGSPTGLRFDPHESSSALNAHIDYLVLAGDTKVSQGSLFNIVYDLTAGANSTVTFYYDANTNPTSGRVFIGSVGASRIAEIESLFSIYLPVIRFNFPDELNLFTGLSYSWDTAGVPKGTYYVSADVTDGVSTTTWYSELPVEVE